MQNSKSDELLNPLNDYLFYKIMGEEGDEYQLIGFLNAVLIKTGKQIDAIESFEKKYLAAEVIGNKSCVLDVRVKLHDGTVINIELQVKNEKNMEKRTLYYSSRLINLSLKEGRDYKELPNIIAINLINFDFLETPNFHTVFRLREDTEHEIILTNSLEIHFINMVKWRNMVNKNFSAAPLNMWLAWLDKMRKPELAEEAVQMDSRIAAAEACLQELSNDERLRNVIEMREKAQLDWNSSINYAHREGLAEGRAEGEAKGRVEGEAKGRTEGRVEGETETRIETARKALAEGLPSEVIQKITGLSLEEISKL
jgi:predicted transposase/invertase (TIGR01784 family)